MSDDKLISENTKLKAQLKDMDRLYDLLAEENYALTARIAELEAQIEASKSDGLSSFASEFMSDFSIREEWDGITFYREYPCKKPEF